MSRNVSRIAVVVAALVVVGCSAAGAPDWAYGPTLGPTPAPTVTPAPTPEPSPTPSPAPTLAYPDVQSEGVLAVTLDGRLDPLINVPIACEWTDTSRATSFSVLGDVVIAGETVHIDLHPEAPHPGQFMIWRDQRAAYVAGPDTGTVEVVDLADDASNGTIRFMDLAPDRETAEPGPFPEPLEPFIAPFGGDPAYATITGTASWRCGAPPAAVPTPGPSVGPEPEPTLALDPFPTVAVLLDGKVVTGEGGCPLTWEIDGRFAGGDTCGPIVPTPNDEQVVTVSAGDDLVLVVDDGWTIETLGYGQATYAEWVRWRGAQPDTFETIRTSSSVDAETVTVPAPPAGDWVVATFWSVTRGDDRVHWSTYIRVVVED